MFSIWLIVASSFLVIELLSQNLWTLCAAIGCVGAIVASLFGLNLVWQFALFCVAMLLALVFVMPPLKRYFRRQADKRGIVSRTGMDALLGRHALVTEEIRPGKIGRVRIDGDSWQAIAPKQVEPIICGTTAVVTAYDSNILTISPLQS